MKKCDGCGRLAGPGARVHRHRTVCPACLSVLFNLELARSHCPEKHEFTEANTLVTKQGYWQCRTCHRDQAREAAQLRREREQAARVED